MNRKSKRSESKKGITGTILTTEVLEMERSTPKSKKARTGSQATMKDIKAVDLITDTYDVNEQRSPKPDVNESNQKPGQQCDELSTLQWPRTFLSRASLCRFFHRQPGPVESLAFTSDGLWLGVGRSGGQIDIYDVYGEVLQMSLPGASNRSVRSLIFVEKLNKSKSSDEFPSVFKYRLISTGLHGLITEWDLLTQTAIREISSFGGAIFGADVSETLGLLATAADDGSVRIFKLRTGAMREKKSSIQQTDESDSDGSEAIDEEECLTYWKSMTRHNGRLLSVCFYADRWLFGGTADSTVLRWLISNGISDAKMSVHKNLPKLSRNTNPNSNGIERRGGPSLASPLPEDTQVWSIIALPFHGVTITGDSLGHVTVWDVITSTALKIFRHHESDTLSLCTNSESFFSVGVDGRLNVFNLTATGEWVHNGSRHPHESDIRAVAISSLGKIATGAADMNVKLISHIESLKPRIEILPTVSPVLSSNWVLICVPLRLVVTVSPDHIDLWYLMGNDDNGMNGLPKYIVNSSSFEEDMKPIKIASIELDDYGPWKGIRSAALSSDGSLISVSNNCGTRLFKLDPTELTIQTILFKKLRQYVCTSMEFCSIGNGSIECLVTGSISKIKRSNKRKLCLTAWDLENQTIVAEFTDVDSAIQIIRVSSDGQWVAIRTCAGCISLYSIDTMQLVFRFPFFPVLDSHIPSNSSSLSMAGAISFSPDSKYLCIMRSSPGVFLLYDTTIRSIVTSRHFKPRYNSYRKCGIFKMVNTSNNMGHVGEVQWYTSSSSNEQSNLSVNPELIDFQIDPTKSIETLLYKTTTGIGTTRFQLVNKTEDEFSDDEENEITDYRKRSRDEEMRGNSDNGHISKLNIPPRLNPCRARTQTWNCEIFRVFTTENLSIQKRSLLIFSQSRQIPSDQLPKMYRRKRFAAK